MHPSVIITPRAKKRIKGKHPWIFSNEIESKPDVPAGTLVDIKDPPGHFLGIGYYNPNTLIAIRILSSNSTFDLEERIRLSCERRQHDSTPLHRLVYSESDALPGLIVDRYYDTLVVQILTAGMESFRNRTVAALIETIHPQRILLRNDSSYRQLEGLPLQVEWVHGDPLDHQILEVDGMKFLVNYEKGQKTGFFLDQQQNCRRLAAYAHGDSMLDAFCYTGSWALYAAKAGMKRITAVDSSAEALASAAENAKMNGYSITTVAADVFEFLRKQYSAPERYDVIVLDPPAFCKSKRHLDQALRGYLDINLHAMKLLNKDGVLFTFSCSQAVTSEIFLDMLRSAAASSGRAFILHEILSQPPDHPILLNFPESHYLKGVVIQVI